MHYELFLRYDYVVFGVGSSLKQVDTTLFGTDYRKLLGSEYIVFVSRKKTQFELFD